MSIVIVSSEARKDLKLTSPFEKAISGGSFHDSWWEIYDGDSEHLELKELIAFAPTRVLADKIRKALELAKQAEKGEVS